MLRREFITYSSALLLELLTVPHAFATTPEEKIPDLLVEHIGNFNDQITRQKIRQQLETYVGSLNLYDYNVICDETNNTPDVIDHGGLVTDVYVRRNKKDQFENWNYQIVCCS